MRTAIVSLALIGLGLTACMETPASPFEPGAAFAKGGGRGGGPGGGPGGGDPPCADVTGSTYAYLASAGAAKPKAPELTVFKLDPNSGGLCRVETHNVGDPSTSVTTVGGHFVYVTSQNSDYVTGFAIDPSDGTLSKIGDYATDSGPRGVSADPAGSHLYVANQSSATVSAFAIGGSGALTEIDGSPFPATAGGSPRAIVFHPSGAYAYVTNHDAGTVSAFSVGPGGTLTWIEDEPVGEAPLKLAVHPSGGHLYVASTGGDDDVRHFAIDAGTGELTQVGAPIATGNDPRSVTVDPTGSFLYTADFLDSSVSAFAIAPADGSLSPVGSASTGSSPT